MFKVIKQDTRQGRAINQHDWRLALRTGDLELVGNKACVILAVGVHRPSQDSPLEIFKVYTPERLFSLSNTSLSTLGGEDRPPLSWVNAFQVLDVSGYLRWPIVGSEPTRGAFDLCGHRAERL